MLCVLSRASVGGQAFSDSKQGPGGPPERPGGGAPGGRAHRMCSTLAPPPAEWPRLPPCHRRPGTVPSFLPTLCHGDLSPPQGGQYTCSQTCSTLRAAQPAQLGETGRCPGSQAEAGAGHVVERQSPPNTRRTAVRVLQSLKTWAGCPGQGTPRQGARVVSGDRRPGGVILEGTRGPGTPRARGIPCGPAGPRAGRRVGEGPPRGPGGSAKPWMKVHGGLP